MKKPFIVANVRDIIDQFNSDEISFSRMVELFNGIAEAFYTKDTHEVSKVECYLCAYEWIAVRPDGTKKLECPLCGNITSFENK